jgi:hypothetical protein
MRLHDEHDGPAELGGELPHALGLDLDSGDGVEDDDRGVRVVDGGARLGREDAVAGGVQEVDPRPAVDGVGDGEVDRDLPIHLLGVEVGRAGPVLDPARPRNGAGGVQEGGDEGGLSDGVVADDGDVAELRCG